MLSNTTLAFLGAINLFMVPVIGLKIYARRHCIKWTLSTETIYLYILMTVLNIPFSRLLVIAMEKIILTTIHVESSKYTIITTVSCTILPFVMECVEKYIKVNVKISIRQSKNKHNIESENSLPLEENNEI